VELIFPVCRPSSTTSPSGDNLPTTYGLNTLPLNCVASDVAGISSSPSVTGSAFLTSTSPSPDILGEIASPVSVLNFISSLASVVFCGGVVSCLEGS
jgi:hypothetical protein